jgi:hypothetical protein
MKNEKNKTLNYLTQDALWKTIFPEFVMQALWYFKPELAQMIDPQHKLEFLSQELQDLEPSQPPKYVDFLIKARLLDGREPYILIHIEIQGYKDPDFAERMYIYYHRIRNKYPQKKIWALAILTDTDINYAPVEYVDEFFDLSLRYKYPIFKLMQKSLQELEKEGNVFSIIMQVARLALERRKSKEAWKLQWLKQLRQKLENYSFPEPQQKTYLLYFLIYYIKFRNPSFQEELKQIVINQLKEEDMAIIETLDKGMVKQYYLAGKRKGKEEGRKEGMEQGLQKGREEGRVEGREEMRKEMEQSLKDAQERLKSAIFNALAQGLPIPLIASIFKVEEDWIKTLQKEKQDPSS